MPIPREKDQVVWLACQVVDPVQQRSKVSPMFDTRLKDVEIRFAGTARKKPGVEPPSALQVSEATGTSFLLCSDSSCILAVSLVIEVFDCEICGDSYRDKNSSFQKCKLTGRSSDGAD